MSISAHRIFAWLSPSFPTGAFAYSHGLEYAIHAGDVVDAMSLEKWLRVLIQQGSAWNDIVLLAHAYRGEEVADLAGALAGTKERYQETLDQGRAFARSASTLLGHSIDPAPLPVVLGLAAAKADIALEDFLPMALHAFAANLVSVAIRLVPLGQTDGQVVLQNLFPVIDEAAAQAVTAELDDLGNMAFRSDLAAMKHEIMPTRIFRT